MKTYTLTESELQELLRQQKQNCLDAYQKENEYPDSDFAMAAILDAPSPLLPTEEVGIKEDDSLVMEGKLINYLGFTHSNRNHLIVEVLGHENYMGNVVKVGDKIQLRHIDVPSDNNNEGASLASHSCAVNNSIQQVLNHIRKKAKTNERKWDRSQTTKDKVRFGTRARMCKELLNEIAMMPISTPNVPVSDTTEADSSNAAGNKKIPSIDWEGLEKGIDGVLQYIDACSYHEYADPKLVQIRKLLMPLKTNLQNYIK